MKWFVFIKMKVYNMQKKLYCGWEDYIYTLMNLKS